MPRLPVSNISKAKLTTAPVSRQLSPDAASAASRGKQKIGQALSQAGDQWARAVDYSQTLTAENNTNQAISDVINRAREDSDYNNYEAYEKELDKIGQSAGEGISRTEAKANFLARSNANVLSAKNKVGGMFRAKTIDHTLVEIDRSHDIHRGEYINAKSPMVREDQKRAFANKVSAARDSSFITEQQQAELMNDLAHWDVERALVDADINAENTLKGINNGEYEIPDGKKKQLIKDIKSIKEVKLTELEIVDTQSKIDAQLSFVENEAEMSISQKLESLEEGVFSGKFSDKWAESKRKAILSEAGVDPKAQNSYFNEVIMQLSDATANYDRTQDSNTARDYLKTIAEVQVKINEGRANGMLDAKDENVLNNRINTITTSKATLTSMEYPEGDIKYATEYLQRGLPARDVPMALRQFLYRTDGKDLTKEEVQKELSTVVDTTHEKARTDIVENVQKIASTTPKQVKRRKKKPFQLFEIPGTNKRAEVYEDGSYFEYEVD
jgi:hypothetical protein